MKPMRVTIITVLSMMLIAMLMLTSPVVQAQESDDNRTIGPGNEVSGTINPITDEDFYFFEGEAGLDVTISMMGYSGMDSYLILIAPDGSWVETDNNGGIGINAFIDTELPQTGTYTIIAKNSAALTTGSYDLLLDLPTEPVMGDDGSDWLGTGDVTSGFIASPDEEDIYYFDATPGTSADIAMVGFDDLDSYLVLIAPDGSWIATNNDGGVNLDAYIDAELQQGGTYTILATNANDTTTGWYDLYLDMEDNIQPGDRDDDRWIGSGGVRRGSIDPATDEDFYYFDADAGTTAIIDMVSLQSLNPYLILIAPDGTWVATDNNDGVDTDAYIETVLPQSGTYTIIATSMADITTGSYELYLASEQE